MVDFFGFGTFRFKHSPWLSNKPIGDTTGIRASATNQPKKGGRLLAIGSIAHGTQHFRRLGVPRGSMDGWRPQDDDNPGPREPGTYGDEVAVFGSFYIFLYGVFLGPRM